MPMTLEDLSAREEIRAVVLTHFRAADRIDVELGRTAFWPDGRFEGGPMQGPAREWLPALYGALLPTAFDLTVHYIMNMTVEVAGDHGFVEAYGLGYHILPADRAALEAALGPAVVAAPGFDATRRHEFYAGVRYAIRVERRSGAWRIAVMQPIIDWTRVAPYSGFDQGGLLDAITSRGRRDRSDPSYALQLSAAR